MQELEIDDRKFRHWVAERIQALPQQRATFAQFMDWVLYTPQMGYYAANRQKIGAGGDFVTSSHLGADFGELLAEQFLDLWQSLGQPDGFQVVEMGAGQGLIAEDVLKYVRSRTTEPLYAAFWQALKYAIIEQSPSFLQEQHLRLKPLAGEHKLSWHTWSDIPDHSVVGCFFSNELVDAFPVHRFEVHSGQLQEIYVEVDASLQFSEIVAEPSTPDLNAYLETLHIDLSGYAEGYRSEINLAALDWLAHMSQKLAQGYVLTIDYGHTATQYYSPQRHQGTLQCYYQQAHHDDPYWAIGHQDITAHANFTALQHFGKQQGLTTLGYTQQGLFLMALGLGDRLQANAAKLDQNVMDLLQRREALHALANPMGLGNFGVLLQGKLALDEAASYRFKGFRDMV